jgi:hypothetical protein
MPIYQTLLAELARALENARLPYMVIGGQAVLVHGEPRLTRDVDVTLGVDASALPNVLRAVQAIGLMPVRGDIEEFVRSANVLPVADARSGIRVDLIFSFTPYEAQAIRRAIGVVLEDATVRFAAVEDLIVHKLVAGRPRDLEDVAGVLARNPSFDETYLIRWLTSFREVVHRDLVEEFHSLRRERDSSHGQV